MKNSIDKAFCMDFFPSPNVERHSKPEVEVRYASQMNVRFIIFLRTTEGACSEPLKINCTATETTLIEPSINSCRISIQIKKSDEVERFLCEKFAKFMTQRADNFIILRRKPVQVKLSCRQSLYYIGLWYYLLGDVEAYWIVTPTQSYRIYHQVYGRSRQRDKWNEAEH